MASMQCPALSSGAARYAQAIHRSIECELNGLWQAMCGVEFEHLSIFKICSVTVGIWDDTILHCTKLYLSALGHPIEHPPDASS